jgi:hypothetical protein
MFVHWLQFFLFIMVRYPPAQKKKKNYNFVNFMAT